MKTKYLAILLLVAALVYLQSCTEKADVTKPIIKIEEPAEGDTLKLGNEVHFEVDFEDDTELKAYKIDIHGNFDGHTHKIASTDSIAWSYQKSWNFDKGQKNAHIHHHEIVVPTQIDGKPIRTGKYHFMVYCTDAAGNESWTAVGVVVAKPSK